MIVCLTIRSCARHVLVHFYIETKTIFGRDVQNAGYNDDITKQIDDLFFRLYCMPLSERIEILNIIRDEINYCIK